MPRAASPLTRARGRVPFGAGHGAGARQTRRAADAGGVADAGPAAGDDASSVREGLERVERLLGEGARCVRLCAADPTLVALLARAWPRASGRSGGRSCSSPPRSRRPRRWRGTWRSSWAPARWPTPPPAWIRGRAAARDAAAGDRDLPYADLSPDRRVIMRRLAVLFRLSQASPATCWSCRRRPTRGG